MPGMEANTVQLKICDDKECEYRWSLDPSTPGTWAEIIWPLDEFTQVDKSQISRIEIYEWGDGIYDFDDIRWR